MKVGSIDVAVDRGCRSGACAALAIVSSCTCFVHLPPADRPEGRSPVEEVPLGPLSLRREDAPGGLGASSSAVGTVAESDEVPVGLDPFFD